MRKDLYSLANKFLKKNINSTLNSIIPLILSIVLLVLSVFIFLSFSYGVMNNIYSNNIYATITVNYNDSKNGNMKNEYKNIIESNNKLNEKIESQTISYSYYSRYISLGSRELETKYPIITINDSNYELEISDSYVNIEFYNLDNSDCYLKEEEKYLHKNNLGNAILAGESLNSSNGIVINSCMLDLLGINYDDIIGKKVSFMTSISYAYTVYYNSNIYEHSGDYINIFKDYYVVGVFNDNIYECPTRNKINHPMFWINDKYINNYDYYEYNEEDNKCYYTKEPIENASTITNLGYVYSGDYLLNKPNDTINALYLYNNFNSAYEAYNEIYRYAFLSVDDGLTLANAYKTSSVLSDYIELNPIISLIIIASIIVSGIIFIATVINMALIIDYQKRRKLYFLCMLQALGYSKMDVKKLFNFQINIQFIISALISFVISLAISLSGTIAWNKIMIESNYASDINYNINFLYFIPSIIIVLGALYLIIKLTIKLYDLIIKNNSINDGLIEE